MKRIFGIFILTISIAQSAWSADAVVMAGKEDLAAFDSMIRNDRASKDGSVRKDGANTGTFGTVVREEAAKLKNEGSQGGGSQPGKWVVEQKKAGRAGSDTTDTKSSQRLRETGRGNKK
jgi:hypothetical protein